MKEERNSIFMKRGNWKKYDMEQKCRIREKCIHNVNQAFGRNFI